MSRPLRVEYPGAFYHVINRGNNREDIFKNNRDKAKFLEYIEIAHERFSLILHIYCLMSNHFHLIVETPEPNLSKTMQWINISYATYFNIKQDRHGHLFQGRFKAILIDADAYLKHLSRYIHLNPVRAKMVSSPSEYAWSSYPHYIGKKKAPKYLETGWLLKHFGKTKKTAKGNYKEFVEGIDIGDMENPNKQVTDGFLLGDIDFINWVKESFLSKRNEEKEIPQLKKLKPRIQPEAIVSAVSKAFNCPEDKIIKKGLKRIKARKAAIYLCRDICGLSGKELGEYFGGVSGALITMSYNQIAEEMAQSRDFKNKITRLKKQIFAI